MEVLRSHDPDRVLLQAPQRSHPVPTRRRPRRIPPVHRGQAPLPQRAQPLGRRVRRHLLRPDVHPAGAEDAVRAGLLLLRPGLGYLHQRVAVDVGVPQDDAAERGGSRRRHHRRSAQPHAARRAAGRGLDAVHQRAVVRCAADVGVHGAAVLLHRLGGHRGIRHHGVPGPAAKVFFQGHRGASRGSDEADGQAREAAERSPERREDLEAERVGGPDARGGGRCARGGDQEG